MTLKTRVLLWLTAVAGLGVLCAAWSRLPGSSRSDVRPESATAAPGRPSDKVAAATPAPSVTTPSTEPRSSATADTDAPARAASTREVPATETTAERADGRTFQLLLGTWEDDYQGHRTMQLNADGTGTMLVELSGLKARLFASRLEFQMVWSVKDRRLHKRTLSGTPELPVKMILATMGDSVDEPILELTEKRLLLLDKDGQTRYDWRRRPRVAE